MKKRRRTTNGADFRSSGGMSCPGRGLRCPGVCGTFLLLLIFTIDGAAAQNHGVRTTKSDKEIEYGMSTPSAMNYSDTQRSNGTYEEVVSKLLNDLISSHDRRIRPNYGGEPIVVNVTAHVTTISAVSEVSMDYTVDLYLRQMWRDDRLAFPKEYASMPALTIGIEMVKSIWTPDTFFPNEKRSFFHEATTHNSFLRINSDGVVLRSIRLTVTANCPMVLYDFPLDSQNCTLEIESYGYGTNDIIYNWGAGNNSVTIDDNVQLAHFTVTNHSYKQTIISLTTGSYSRLSAEFIFQRNIGFYLIQIYFPSSLIVVISWVSFWLNREAVQARVAIGVTTVLTMTTLMTSTNGSLPKVSYVKSLDIFLGVCFFIVFASLLEYAAVGYLLKRHRRKVTESNGAPSPVHYFETETGATLSPAIANGRKSSRNRAPKRSGPLSIQMNHLNAEHIVPLLVAVPVTRRPKWRFRPAQVDLLSRFLFPAFFVIFQILYWYFYFFRKVSVLPS